MTNRYQAVLSATHFKCSFCQFDCTTLHGRFQSDMQVTNCKPAYQLSLAKLNTVKSNQGDSPFYSPCPPPTSRKKNSLCHILITQPKFCAWVLFVRISMFCNYLYVLAIIVNKDMKAGIWVIENVQPGFFLKNKIAWNWG